MSLFFAGFILFMALLALTGAVWALVALRESAPGPGDDHPF